MDTLADRELLRLCSPTNQSEVLGVLYRRHSAVVYSFAFRLTGTRALAEDICQEVFAKLTLRAPHAETPLRAWLLRVTRNLFIDHRRRVMLDIDRLRDFALWPSMHSPSLAAAVDGAATLSRVESALQQMPLSLREAIVLVCMEELSAAEAGEVLGITPESVRQRVARGRALLRRRLEES